MTPERFLRLVIRPGLALLRELADEPRFEAVEAEVFLLTTAITESGLKHRHQVGGPAHGYFQFEKGGAFTGVIGHPRTAATLGKVLDELALPGEVDTLFEALQWNDLLQVAFARLLLWTDTRPLPALGGEAAAWDCYLRLWRPGKPGRERWRTAYATALATVADATERPSEDLVAAQRAIDQAVRLLRDVRVA